MVSIHNLCAEAPKGLVWQVRRSLRCLDLDHLEGLGMIILVDRASPLTEDSREWLKTHFAQGLPVYGWYTSSLESGHSAYITLCIRQIYNSVPSFLWWSTLPTLRIIRTLAHEVAHHLFQMKGYINQPGDKKEDEEVLAESYAVRTLQRILSKWQYKLGGKMAKEIAFWHYSQGILDLKSKQYLSASNHFFKAWDLDPELQDVSSFYWQAKEMSLTEQ